VYSIAQLDVSGGPVHLNVPDTDGRYYVLQFVDAWTNNFAYVGHRATGTQAARFLLVAPGWEGTPSEGERVIRLPTDVATIVGRWAVDGEEDLPAVRALQAALTLEPSGETKGLPETASADNDLVFLEQLRTWMRAFPPATRDREYEQRFAPLGLLEPVPPFGEADPDLDFFELGALDDDEWKLADGPARYGERAASARAGLWGNHGYEAAYAMVYVDAGGEQLDGRHSYELRFETPPPVGAFWSVTMYDVPDFFLVDNAIARYSIGDRTPELAIAEDGSLTIRLQHDEPSDAGARANWLPAPPAPFRPLLRMYEPDDAVFNGGYELPPITRVG
jgi:hypothetical protein